MPEFFKLKGETMEKKSENASENTSYEIIVAEKIKESKNSESRSRLFSSNKKYLTISVYAILVIFVGAIIWKLVSEYGTIMVYAKKAFAILSPFIFGAFIAFLLNPLVKYFRDVFFTKYIKLKSAKLKMILAILFSYLIFFGLIIVLLSYIVPQIITSLKDLALQIPEWYSRIEHFLVNFEKNHPDINLDYDLIAKELQGANILQSIIDRISNFIPNLVTFLFNTSVTIIKFVINLLISIMVSVYILADRKPLIYGFKRILYAIFPKKATEVIIDVMKETNNIFSGFIFGKAVDSIIIEIICFIAMKLFRFDYALLISVVVGITNMIPYFGPYMGGAFGVLILIIINPIKAILFFVLILAIQQFDGLYLGPKILGKSMGTRPLWIIFSITVGGSLYGVIGMFLGVPVFAVISYIVDRIISYRLRKKNIAFDENITDLSHHIKG